MKGFAIALRLGRPSWGWARGMDVRTVMIIQKGLFSLIPLTLILGPFPLFPVPRPTKDRTFSCRSTCGAVGLRAWSTGG